MSYGVGRPPVGCTFALSPRPPEPSADAEFTLVQDGGWVANARSKPANSPAGSRRMHFKSTRRLFAIALSISCIALPMTAVSCGAASAHQRTRDAARARDTTPQGFTIAAAPYAFVFPRDHAAHPAYQTEWWYYTGHLTTRNGRRFGYELTFFRIGLKPGDPRPLPGQSKWRGHELFPAHFAITDERGKTFFHVERLAREALGMGHASTERLDVQDGRWYLRGNALGNPLLERMAMHASAATAEGTNALDLEQCPRKPPAIHGVGGVSRKAACRSCASHYYSYTRLRTRGTLVFDGTSYTVEGISWMDHEFGSGELERDQAGWDWFSIQLDDGRELMLYRLRRKDGSVTPQSSGSLVARDGSVRYLPLEAFSTDATAHWKSSRTGADYPSAWRVRVPSAGIDLTLTPTVADQELAEDSGVSYWEGAVDVRDAAQTSRRLGTGYVELTGYAGAISL